MGDDRLVGGDGNDYYIVDSATDTIVDSMGNDTVRAAANYTLAGGLEIETIEVSGSDINVVGSASPPGWGGVFYRSKGRVSAHAGLVNRPVIG